MAECTEPAEMTPCQLVAYNLRRARLLRDWTQEQAAERLEPYLGTRWSKANYSAAERSVTGERVRQFTPDELFAFARGFSLPLTFFLIPPLQLDVRIRHLSGAEEPAGAFLRLVFGSEDNVAVRLAERDEADSLLSHRLFGETLSETAMRLQEERALGFEENES